MAKYRKIPVEIEAVQWNGNNYGDIVDFTDNNVYKYNGCLFVKTLEGTLNANVGDYIIKGIKGEFYPCKPDIFKKTYEEVK